MAPVVERICSPLQLGEGPHWDHSSQTLYFVDIIDQKVHRYDPSTKEHTSVKVGGESVGFVVPVDGQPGKFFTTQQRRVVLMTWDGKSDHPQVVENLFEVDDEPGKEQYRINDGKADPTGRLWAGTMPPIDALTNVKFDACLFSLENGKPLKRESGIGLSNGLAWSSDCKTMYYIDSPTHCVAAYDFEPNSGRISNKRTIFDLRTNDINGFPDGMTIDCEDKLWIAVFDGAKVLRVDPTTGKLMSTVDIPAMEVTSVAFGGPNLDELFVTTAQLGVSREMRAKYPDSGCAFRVTGLGVKGLPGKAAKRL